jgi:hypothetical protein
MSSRPCRGTSATSWLLMASTALARRLARPISRQSLVGLAAQHQPAGSRLTLERVDAVVSVGLQPLADRVDDAVDGGLRCRDQPSHLDSPSVRRAPSGPPSTNETNGDSWIHRFRLLNCRESSSRCSASTVSRARRGPPARRPDRIALLSCWLPRARPRFAIALASGRALRRLAGRGVRGRGLRPRPRCSHCSTSDHTRRGIAKAQHGHAAAWLSSDARVQARAALS